MCEHKNKHVHFMGICGSGCASIALLAYHAGYTVSGCDMSADSYYASELKKNQIKIYTGHSKEHLKDVDIVAVSPALFDIAPDNEELLEAQRLGILMTWQEFLGSCIQKDKQVIAISGTHGKTTTTFLTSEVFIDAAKDPSVMGGSVYRKWGSGGRSGNSSLFICEADEFNRNFLHYKPETAVMTIVEMDHPECYVDFEDMLTAYTDFLKNDPNLKNVVFNAMSEGAVEVVRRFIQGKTGEELPKLISFSKETADLSFLGVPVLQATYKTEEKSEKGTAFKVTFEGEEHSFFTRMYGEYNVQNAVTTVLSAWLYDISDEEINASFSEFSGVGRRFDLVGEHRNLPVYDDYAHHPTEISSVLSMCREYFGTKKVLAIFEPHQVSRLRLMLDEYVEALAIADHIIVGKTHLGREIHKNVVPITPEEWKNGCDRIEYCEETDGIISRTDELIDSGECDMIVVIGAANSYKISRKLCGKE